MDSRVQRLEMGLFHIGHSHGCSSCPARKCTEFLQVQSSHRQSIHFRGQRNRKLPTQTDQRLLIVTSLFLRALNVYASTAASFLQEGDAAVANGDYTTAVRHYSGFIDLNPAAAIGYSKRSAVYVQQKTYKEAIYDLDKAVEVDPVFVQGYLNRGRLFRQSCRNLDEGRMDLRTLIRKLREEVWTRKE
ncbi:hypothetical protein MPTK1_4g16524 [Marchantia polymorpha subsp. ruderalis]